MAVFCSPSELGYINARSQPDSGKAFILDESYRLAHLPLVAPHHPDVIARKSGTDYEMGRHGRVSSLVLPIETDALEASPAWRAFTEDLRSQPFSDKLAWDLLPKRRNRLHATLCGSLRPDDLAGFTEASFHTIAPFEIELRGVFSGNLNLGRLYIPVYPEKVAGHNVIHLIQQAISKPMTSMYLVGVHNLTDHLSSLEAAALGDVLARWQQHLFVRLVISELWLLGSYDDLVLDAAIDRRFRLRRASSR